MRGSRSIATWTSKPTSSMTPNGKRSSKSRASSTPDSKLAAKSSCNRFFSSFVLEFDSQPDAKKINSRFDKYIRFFTMLLQGDVCEFGLSIFTFGISGGAGVEHHRVELGVIISVDVVASAVDNTYSDTAV